MVFETIERMRIVPVVKIQRAEDALPLCAALKEGGLGVVEITFRTKAAPEAIRAVRSEMPEFVVGGGTITTIDELDAAREAGAQFGVAPGLNPDIVEHALAVGLPFVPGVATASEIERGLALGCRLLKFFPAGVLGGVKAIKALYAPYAHRGVRFLALGGVNAGNMMEYLEHPGVAAIGGSWMVKSDLIEARDWRQVTRLASEAVGKAS